MGTCKVTVEPGVCRLNTVVYAEPSDDLMSVNVRIESECKFVRDFGAALKPIDPYTEFSLPMVENPVYKTASGTVQHSACPVPCAVLKAIEVAADLGLKRDVKLTIE